MPMLEEDSNIEVSAPFEPGAEPKQRRQMLIALALLLVALILVLVKDREFWFPSATTAESESADQTAIDAGITNRAVLPPLEVEVVAGDQHRTVQPGNNSIKVDLQGKPSTTAAEAVLSAGMGGDGGGLATSAGERVRLSPGAAQVVSHPVEPTYPLLAKQMKVQGSVVLQALIAKDGNIQNLQVLSGPAILSSAAREAVKQWRFKPYLQAGQAVETEARITVNFTISTQ